jgi:hypothetical protein
MIEPLRTITAFVRAGDKLDVVASGGALLVMREKGRLKQVWETKERLVASDTLCYDGRYVWFPVSQYLHPALLVVLDTMTDEVSQVTAEDGLPVIPAESLPDQTWQSLAAAPLGPGRICLAGWFGRTWLAIVTFDPRAGKSVKVFHEARERAESREDWKRTTIAFSPRYMCTLTDKPDGSGKAAQRVLIGRNGPPDVEDHPLCVDPETLSVEVEQEQLAARNPGLWAGHDGALYLFMNARTLGRFGFPKLKTEPVLSPIALGHLVLSGDRVMTVGKPWWAGSLSRKEAHPAGEMVGDFAGAWPSAHYGLLVQGQLPRTRMFYQAVLPDVWDEE